MCGKVGVAGRCGQMGMCQVGVAEDVDGCV